MPKVQAPKGIPLVQTNPSRGRARNEILQMRDVQAHLARVQLSFDELNPR